MGSMPKFVLAIDQGTTSTRSIIYDEQGARVGIGQREHRQIFPEQGWVEHDPNEIWDNTRLVIATAIADADVDPSTIRAIGITNQRETTVVWDKRTGEPVYNAIVWQDTRTAGAAGALGLDQAAWLERTGLLINSYPAGPKIAWILDHVDGARERAEHGELAFGTIDAWLLFKLTGQHRTDVTNASRTLLMNLDTLEWDPELCEKLRVPASMLPEICSSVDDFGTVTHHGLLEGIPVTAVLGDQQAAMFGQGCFSPGQAKCTYGTGLFLLLNTGSQKVTSANGMLSTVCYRIRGEKPVYALEGSVAVGGALIQWLRDNLGIIRIAPEVERLAQTVPDNGGVTIVPAFSGLFAPRWVPDARGIITGLTRFATKAHLARAALEATAMQVREVTDAMVADSGVELEVLRVDGGMVANELLMQLQADVLGVDVLRPVDIETTASGVAYAAGLGAGLWETLEVVASHAEAAKTWAPAMDAAKVASLVAQWNEAVARSL
ncbi:glycerol kinase GlpK [Corynebacterium vitaeruminis]|nr:glycerol kinase GlpK [Corynebacterium vitaeruminis]